MQYIGMLSRIRYVLELQSSFGLHGSRTYPNYTCDPTNLQCKSVVDLTRGSVVCDDFICRNTVPHYEM